MAQLSSIVLSEHVEAVHLAQYLLLLQRQGKILLFSHIPNETFTTRWSVKMRNKQEGVNMGVPDYIIVTQKKVIFIELKRVKNSTTSLEQKAWLLHLQDKTTDSHLAKGFDDAKAYLDSKLAIEGLLE